MNAPWYELLIRLGVALAATAALGLTLVALRRARSATPGTTPVPLIRFLVGVLALSSVWRWFLVWLGMQPEGYLPAEIAAWIQPLNAAVLFTVYFSVALISYHHARVRGGFARAARARMRAWIGGGS